MYIITATRIHNGKEFLPEGAAIALEDDGTVAAVLQKGTYSDAHHYEGILCPGFVNAHCHLELSHMHGVIPEHSGMLKFLKGIPSKRFAFTDEEKRVARFSALQQMTENGIVAVGDIANTTDAIDLRAAGKIHFHTFVEAIGFTPERAVAAMASAIAVKTHYDAQQLPEKVLRAGVVPHAPYSVSEALFRSIGAAQQHELIAIHNEEWHAENEFYQQGSGEVLDLLHSFHLPTEHFQPSGNTSLQTYSEWLPATASLLFVHNVHTTMAEIVYAENRFAHAFWCLCPGANLYIQNRLPDINMLTKATENICVGTDSLASNHRLSVLHELCLLKQHFPELEWQSLLRWGTWNGACALRMQHQVGSFEAGIKPGVLLLSALDDKTPLVTVIA